MAGRDSGDAPTLPLDADTLAGNTRRLEPEIHDSGPAAQVTLPERAFADLTFEARYADMSQLGEGGMGLVLACADQQIGRRVAMKVIRGDYRQHAEAEARFLREARVQGQLEHPSVVPVYDMGVDPNGSAYFTMKRVRGTTLDDVLNGLRSDDTETKSRFSRRRLLAAFGNICLAVDFAHRRGVLHRDLKPANIMLGEFGEVYVLDWGLSRLTGASEPGSHEAVSVPESAHGKTRVGSVLGTPGYMSPEQLQGRHDQLTPAADVYSLGAILFEILTLQPLHVGPALDAVMASTLGGSEARPSVRAPQAEVPPELERVVVQATILQPEQRYASARELNDALERYLDGERDLLLRAELADRHAGAAAEAQARALAGGEQALEFRRSAMREVGRALALAPDNERAMRVMIELLSAPPHKLPPEVATEIASNERHKLRWVAKVGGFAYLSVLLFVPLLAWNGARDPLWLALPFVAAALTSALSFIAAYSRAPSHRLVLGSMFCSNLAFAATSALFGPLFVSPMMIAVNTTGYALNLDPSYRNLAIGTGALAMALPVLMWKLGWLPGGYSFGSETITLHAGAISYSEPATVWVLLAINFSALLIGALSVGRVRDTLSATERQVFTYAWHLREFAPRSIRKATDPTGARRARRP